ncbi:MAG: hypothetical protein IJ769_06110 [Clostridia bacterium]|nr:hypothetical protein [Clostridia bacterium]
MRFQNSYWHKARAIRIALWILTAILIACGIANGGMRDVLYKAKNICTECIGLG